MKEYFHDRWFAIGLCLIFAILFSIHYAYATEPLEMYVTIPLTSYNESGDEITTPNGVELVITDQDCEKWTRAQSGLDLHYAYALNKKTSEKVEGCFGHDEKFIYINLVDEHTKNIFNYRINADNFVKRQHI